MDRRTVLRAMAVATAACGCSKAFAQGIYQGCSLSGADADDFSNQFEFTGSSGNALIDSVFPAEISILNSAFLVQPDFAFYDDYGSMNEARDLCKSTGEFTSRHRHFRREPSCV